MPRQIVPFTPKKVYSATCSATAAATTFFDQPGESVRVVNTGSVTAFLVFGTATQAVSSTVGMHIPAGQTEVFGRPATHARVITSSGATTLQITVGDGL